MIYVLHGDNTEASHERLTKIISSEPSYQKIRLESAAKEELLNHLTSTDLFASKKAIIVDNFISKSKLKPQELASFPAENILILWEGKELTKLQLAAFAKLARVETFKLPATLFYFLDSLATSQRLAIHYLNKIEMKDRTMLVWHILNRLTLLILAKLGLNTVEASKILGKNVPDWQWTKIKTQANGLELNSLKQIFLATLKLDYLTKTGKTSIPQKTLISLLLIKYTKG